MNRELDNLWLAIGFWLLALTCAFWLSACSLGNRVRNIDTNGHGELLVEKCDRYYIYFVSWDMFCRTETKVLVDRTLLDCRVQP